MDTSTTQAVKLALVSFTGLTKDSLHIYVGLAVFLLVAAWIGRGNRRYFFGWLAALALALLGEFLDMRDDVRSIGHWRWPASVHDVVNTLFWPTILWGIVVAGRPFKRMDET